MPLPVSFLKQHWARVLYHWELQGHPAACLIFTVHIRPTRLTLLESTGPCQRNNAGLVFMCCVVLEIQLLFFFHLHAGLVTGNQIFVIHRLLYLKDHTLYSCTLMSCQKKKIPAFSGSCRKHASYSLM